MAKNFKPKNERLWYHEVSKLQARISTLQKHGVEVHYQLVKPDKVTKRDIEQIRKLKQLRLIKGVSNKQVKLTSILPSDLKVNRYGKLVPKVTPTLSPNFKNKEPDVESAIKEDEKGKSTEVEKAEQETGLTRNQWSFSPDDDEQEEGNTEQPQNNEKREAIEKAAEQAKANKEKQAQEQQAEEERLAAEEGITVEEYRQRAEQQAQQIEEENRKAQDEYNRRYRSASKEAAKANPDTFEVKEDEILYYEDKNTGTRYSADDSRIFLRDARGYIRHDIYGKPIIKPNLIPVVTSPLSSEDYDDLTIRLLKDKYESMASDRAQVVSDFIDKLLQKFSPSRVRYAFESAAADGYEITYADMYEGTSDNLAHKLEEISNRLGNEARTAFESVAETLSAMDEANESWEPPV